MIKLKNLFTVTAIAKTSTRIFKDMQIGDTVEISVEISKKRKGGNKGNYATFYTVTLLSDRYFSDSSAFSGSEIVNMQEKGFSFEDL